MWIFTPRGFFSIVEDKDDAGYLVVRARVKGDIEAQWPDALVEDGGAGDYRFRTWLTRNAVVTALATAINEMDYSNYNSCVENHRRTCWYMRVWPAAAETQETLAYDGRVDRS